MEATGDSILGKLTIGYEKYTDYEYPRVSIIIPAYNCAQSISMTIESVLGQKYHNYEIVVVDGGSTDRTVEVVKSFRDDKIHIFTSSGSQRYLMINKGISQATGAYINILFPGDFYIYHETLLFIMNVALDHEKPHLAFCGTLIRDGKSDVKVLYRHLAHQVLLKGQQPTSLQSMWFRTDVFDLIGKFDTNFKLRGGYDLLCRYMLHKKFHTVSSSRVLTDYDLRMVTRRMVTRHFIETFIIIHRYFGLWRVIRWLFLQKDLSRFINLWFRSFKVAFVGRA